MFYLICVWINGWINNGEAGDLRRYRTHFDVIVMVKWESFRPGRIIVTGGIKDCCFDRLQYLKWRKTAIVTAFLGQCYDNNGFLAWSWNFMIALSISEFLCDATPKPERSFSWCQLSVFVVSDGTQDHHSDNLQCHQWWYSGIMTMMTIISFHSSKHGKAAMCAMIQSSWKTFLSTNLYMNFSILSISLNVSFKQTLVSL